MSITGRVRTPIPNNKFLHKSESIVGEIKEYKLSPEELAEYKLSPEELAEYKRTGVLPNDKKDKESETTMKSKLELLEEKYPDLESLLKSKEGKSMTQWAMEHDMSNSYFYQLEKKYQGQVKEADVVDTVTVFNGMDEVEGIIDIYQDGTTEIISDDEKIKERLSEVVNSNYKAEDAAPEVEYADNYMIQFNDGLEAECSTLDEAILHIKTRHNLLTIGGVRLYKEIPFNMQVNVTVGK